MQQEYPLITKKYQFLQQIGHFKNDLFFSPMAHQFFSPNGLKKKLAKLLLTLRFFAG